MVRVISCLVAVTIVLGICHGRVTPSDYIDSVEVGEGSFCLFVFLISLV